MQAVYRPIRALAKGEKTMATILTIYAILSVLSLVFILVSDQRKYMKIEESLVFSMPTKQEILDWKQALGYTEKEAQIEWYCELYEIYTHKKDERKQYPSLQIGVSIEIKSICKDICETQKVEKKQDVTNDDYMQRFKENSDLEWGQELLESLADLEKAGKINEQKRQQKRKLTKEERFQKNITKTIQKRENKRQNAKTKKVTLTYSYQYIDQYNVTNHDSKVENFATVKQAEKHLERIVKINPSICFANINTGKICKENGIYYATNYNKQTIEEMRKGKAS
jgi:hypothetical protein